MGKKITFILWSEIKYDGRVQKEIRSLQKFGNEVELIVSHFNNDDYSNYDFKIHLVSGVRRGCALLNLFEKFLVCRKVFRKLEKDRPEIVHCNDLTTLYGGCLYKKKYPTCKLIYDSHELFLEIKKGSLPTLIWSWIEKKLIPNVDEIIMPEPNRAVYFEKKYGLKKSIKIIENYPVENTQTLDRNYLNNMFPAAAGQKKVLYIGSILPSRHLEAMIAAASSFPKKFCFCIVGFAPDGYLRKLKQLASQSDNRNNVFFGGPVPNSDVINYIRSADVGLVFYKNNNLNNYYCASNKLYEFINSGIPLVTNNYPGLLSVVAENKLGVCIDEVTPSKITMAVERTYQITVLENLFSQFTWESIEPKFIDIYN